MASCIIDTFYNQKTNEHHYWWCQCANGKGVVGILEEKGYEVIPVSRSTTPAMDIVLAESIKKVFKLTGAVYAVICPAGHTTISDQSLSKLIEVN